jgi:hypothetical protein
MNTSHVEQYMNVICNAANHDEWRTHVTQYRRKIAVNTFAYIILEKWKSILGAKNQMSVQL